MEKQTKLNLLNNSELQISGGSCPECRIKNQEGLFTWHQVGDFFRGVWDGFTE
jgi:hypothetical protein